MEALSRVDANLRSFFGDWSAVGLVLVARFFVLIKELPV